MNHDPENPRDDRPRLDRPEFDGPEFAESNFDGPDFVPPEGATPNWTVLDANLRSLLRRAYVPVLAEAAFRARIERDFLARADELRLGPRRPHATSNRATPSSSRSWSSSLLRVALAASLLAMMVLGFRAGSTTFSAWWARWTGAPSATSIETILARGEVAWRDAQDAAWRSHPTGEVAPALVAATTFLEVATPDSGSARVELAALDASDSVATWNVQPSSRVVVKLANESVAAHLLAGELIARRALEPSLESAAERSVRVATSEGEIDLLRGNVSVAYRAPADRANWIGAREPEVQFVRVAVDSGSVRVRDALGSGLLTLTAGDEVYLASGSAWLPRVSRSGGERAPVALPKTANSPQQPEHGVFGFVTANGVALERFRIVALRDVQLPQRAEPTGFDFEHAEGRYELNELAPGRYTLFALAPELAVVRTEVVDVPPSGAVRIDIAMNAGALATGVVVDDQTGAPISDAYVVSETDSQLAVLAFDESDNQNFDRAVRTRGNGAFDFPMLGARTQVLRASAAGYGAAWLEIALEVGQQRRDLEFRLPRAGRIVGSVRDAFDAPVANVLVLASTTDFQAKRPCLSYRSTLTDESGAYAIEDLGPGAWAMLNFGEVSKLRGSNFTPEMAFGAVRSGGTTTIDFHARKPPQVLRGFVRNSRGEPVRRRSLMVGPVTREYDSIESGWSSCATLDDGSYSLPGLEPGLYEMYVSLSSPSEMMRLGRFEVPPGASATRDFVLPSNALVGRVIDGERDTAMSGAVLILLLERADGEREFYGKVFTGTDGAFRFDFVPEGRFDVYAYSTREDYGQESALGVTVANGVTTAPVQLTLKLGGRVTVRVVDSEGAAVPGAEIEFVDAAGLAVQFSDETKTNLKGHYVVNGIKPGRWTVKASLDGRGDDAADVEVAAEQRVEVTLTLRGP